MIKGAGLGYYVIDSSASGTLTWYYGIDFEFVILFSLSTVCFPAILELINVSFSSYF